MKAEEIFAESVKAMKEILTPMGMLDSIGRSKLRSEAENAALVDRHRESINELVRKIVESGPAEALAGAPQELIDAMVLRYLRNREIFMKTFPLGIENIDAVPVLLWAAIMISPHDEASQV